MARLIHKNIKKKYPEKEIKSAPKIKRKQNFFYFSFVFLILFLIVERLN
tara:strand:- start:311 stop:457 length:147 start_codon:yes stop_codon:yes gene_type:complete